MAMRMSIATHMGDKQLELRARIRVHRKRCGFGSVQLARRLGWPRQTVIKIEQGTRYVSIEEIARIAATVGVPAAVIMADAVPALVLF